MARMRLIRTANVVAATLVALVLAATQAFAAAPIITSISPTSGNISGQTAFACSIAPGVTQVTITGTNFTGVSAVYIGGSLAPILGVDTSNPSANLVSVCPPAGIPGVADVLVMTPGGGSSLSGQSLYTYFGGGPSVTSVGPQFGLTQGGNQVFIAGNNFVPGTDANGVPATKVFFGSVQATNVVAASPGSLTATVPAGTSAGAVGVTVTTAGGSGGGVNYLYLDPAAPFITSVTPGSGPTGGATAVTIKGTFFTGVTQVTFGGVPATGTTIKSNGEITTTAPAHPGRGAVDVVLTVQVPGGGATYTSTGGGGLFTYETPRPIVSSISPSAGSTAGGTAVTIYGQYFTDGSLLNGASGVPIVNAVTIGGTAVTTYTVVDDTHITATTAQHAAGTFDVAVSTTSLTGTTLTGTGPNGGPLPKYTYGTPPPTVASISVAGGGAASGGLGGGTPVTITGSGFTNVAPATGVKIGGTLATNVIIVSDTTITATTPAHGAGTVNVMVSRCDVSPCPPNPLSTGTGGSFTYTASVPTVTAVSPTSGPTQGGTLITITGTNFSGQPQVTVGGVQAKDVAVINSTSIQATTPAGTGTQHVVVTTSFGTTATSAADQFTYTVPALPPPPPAPTVTAISPNSGTTSGGTPVTITGTDFTGATAVTIGGNPATNVVVVGPTTITATTPAGSLGPKDVLVTTPGGSSTGGTGLYTYVTVAPAVTAISPNSGTTQGGTSVTITGTNLSGATAVTIGGTAATGVIVLNATTIVATTPLHAAGANVPIVVTTLAGSSPPANLYTYVAAPPPTVTAISPNTGNTASGTSVTITGTNFTNANSVTIGGAAATFVTVVSATSITATTPAHVAGVVDVVVTTPAGPGTGTGLYTYFAPPTVTGISPNSGPIAGGTVVTITGTNFTGTTVVKVGNTSVPFVLNGPTSITITLPPGTGTAAITVTTPGGTSPPTSAGQFTYLGPVPTVTAVSPNTGIPSGGTSVIVTGTNFTGATAVKFGAATAASFTVNSATSITATSPAGSVGVVDVTVTTPNGTSATSAADRFTYAKAFTSMVFTSTPNPSKVGEPVTFAATITGNSPTGQVTFTLNGTVIGAGTLSASGVATFVTSSLPAGSNPVTAAYPGDANNEPDPVTVNQIVGVGAPADSVNLRRLHLAATPIVASVSGNSIRSAIDNAIGVGFSGVPQQLTPNGSGFTYYFDPEPQPSRNLGTQEGAPLTDQAKIDADFEAILGYAGPPKAPYSAPIVAPRRWLAWIDVRGSEFNRSGLTDDLKGTQWNAIAGLTHLITPDFLIGVLGGYEQFNFSSQAYNGVLKGNGWTTGAFLAWRLAPGVRFDLAGAWSRIAATDTAGTATGDFTGSRWFASGGLTGTYNWDALTIEPSAQVYALWESENEYTDSLGTLQDARSFYTGRGSAGMKVSYLFGSAAGGLAPYAGLYGDYYFSRDNGTIDALTITPIIQGWGARATGGITATFGGGAQVSAGGEFSGIGSNTQIWTYRMRGYVPF